MTTTFNPIIDKEKVSILKLLLLRPRPEPGVAFVLVRQGHAAVALWSDDQLKAHHIWSGDYQMLYRIDVSEHTLDIDCSLPCASAYHYPESLFWVRRARDAGGERII